MPISVNPTLAPTLKRKKLKLSKCKCLYTFIEMLSAVRFKDATKLKR